MTKINGKTEFFNLSAKLCGRMVSLNHDTRIIAAKEAQDVLASLPTCLLNSPHCQDEIKAMILLINKEN